MNQKKIPVIKISDIRFEYLPLFSCWGCYAHVRIDDNIWIARCYAEIEPKKKERIQIKKILQNQIDIRFGAYMQGYHGDDAKRAFRYAAQWFNDNPEYKVAVKKINDNQA